MRTIGVISDTHGLLRPEAIGALEGSELILHAGDVGGAEILERLARIAPVRAVRGNTDRGALAQSLPSTDVVPLGDGAGHAGEEAGEPLAYVIHELEHLDLDPAAAGFGLVVFGHTHRPSLRRKDGVVYFNPGAAGHRRFDLPITVGRIGIEPGGEIDARVIHLEV